MALLINCPDCEAENRVEDGKRGKNVACKTCGTSFKVEDAKHVDDPTLDKRKTESDDEDDDKPKKKKSSRTDLDDDEEDAKAARRRRAAERAEERGSGQARGGHTIVASGGGKWAIIGGSVFGVVVLVVMIIIFTQVSKKTQESPKPNNNPPPQTAQVSEIDRQLEGVKNAQRHACMWFAGKDPKEFPDRRAEVAQALEQQLTAPDSYTAQDAARALKRWGDSTNVPAIAKAINTPHSNASEERGFRDTLISILGDMRDVQAAKPLVDFVLIHPEHRDKITEAMRKIGTPAESQAQRLLHESDTQFQIIGCKILTDIGTASSIAQLDPLIAAGKNSTDKKVKDVGQEATKALKAINARGK
jgi:hypothetical protein